MPFVPDFRPSQNGLHFPNDFPDVNYEFELFSGASIRVGSASNGMCGGMVFTVRDLFEAGLPPPLSEDPPGEDSLLFQYLCHRLLDSFNLPNGPLRYLELMNPSLPDHETWLSGWWSPLPHGRAWIMIKDEWPTIKKDLDNGILCPMGLIQVKTTDPTMLGHNHQVLAYGYDLDGDENLSLHLYDPNHPLDDNVRLLLNISHPEHTTYVTMTCGRSYPPADTEPPECASVRASITRVSNDISLLQQQRSDLNPRNAVDRAEIRKIGAEVKALQQDLTRLQQRFKTLGCIDKFRPHEHKSVYCFFRIPYEFSDPYRIAGHYVPPPPLRVTVTPDPIVLKIRTQVTVQAMDPTSRSAVSGDVNIEGKKVGQTAVPFWYTFNWILRREFDPKLKRWISEPGYPEGTVTATGYIKAVIPFHFEESLTLTTRVTPSQIEIGKTLQVTVFAEDQRNHAPVSGTVSIGSAVVGTTNVPFTYAFNEYAVTAIVVADGYASAVATFNIVEPSECGQVRNEIARVTQDISDLERTKSGLNGQDPADRAEIKRITAEVSKKRKERTTLQQRLRELKCK